MLCISTLLIIHYGLFGMRDFVQLRVGNNLVHFCTRGWVRLVSVFLVMSIFQLSQLKVASSGVSRTSVRAFARAVGSKPLAISRSSVRATARAVGNRPLAISRSSVRAIARAVGSKPLAIRRTSVRACAGSRMHQLILIDSVSPFSSWRNFIYAIIVRAIAGLISLLMQMAILARRWSPIYTGRFHPACRVNISVEAYALELNPCHMLNGDFVRRGLIYVDGLLLQSASRLPCLGTQFVLQAQGSFRPAQIAFMQVDFFFQSDKQNAVIWNSIHHIWLL